VYASSKLVGTYDTTGLHFHLEDPLGTRRMQLSGNPNQVGVPETDIQSWPYGDQLYSFPDQYAPSTANDSTPLHFTGKERDAESGNDYFGARYYSSSMGRFMSPDYNEDGDQIQPVPFANLEDPQGLNQYAYAGNNPLINIDPDGHCGQATTGVRKDSNGKVIQTWSATDRSDCQNGLDEISRQKFEAAAHKYNPNNPVQKFFDQNRNAWWMGAISGGCIPAEHPGGCIQSGVLPWGMVGTSSWGMLSSAEQTAINGVMKGIANGTNKGKEFLNFAMKETGGTQPLPAQVANYYREYTVSMGAGRGATRLVTGDGGEIYYTVGHYISGWMKLQ
jgi:RHS repeat-associated protein